MGKLSYITTYLIYYINYMSNCYYFKNITYNNGLFDDFVDMTYVLLMENSIRESRVYNELNLFKPSKNVKIQYNKGYKNCKKVLCNNKSNWDIMDSTYNIMLDAQKNNYNNILILEDDFVINDRELFNKNTIEDLKHIINTDNIDILLLGITSVYITLSNHKIHKCGGGVFNIPCGGTQGYITKKSLINKYIDLYKINCNEAIKLSNNGHIDWYYSSNKFNTYFYYKPLIVQSLDITENRTTTWNSIITDIFIDIFDLNNNDKNNLLRSYDNLYLFNYILIYLLIILIIIIICILNLIYINIV